MNGGSLVTPLGDAVISHLASLTGRRAEVLRDDLIGLVLEQFTDSQVNRADLALIEQVQQNIDAVQSQDEVPTIAEARACLNMVAARGNPPFVIPDLTVNVQNLTEEELRAWHTLFDLYEAIPGGRKRLPRDSSPVRSSIMGALPTSMDA